MTRFKLRAAGLFIAIAASLPCVARADLQLADVIPSVVHLHGISRAADKPTLLAGTGFLVTKDDQYFIVTAQHVAQALPPETMATFRNRNGEAVSFEVSGLHADPAAWVWHPEADVAAMRVVLPASDAPPAVVAVAFDQLAKKDEAPGVDTVLTVVGFPLNLATEGKFSPVIKSAHPASELFRHDRFDKHVETTMFVLDDPTIAAFRGAPAFQLPYVRSGGVGVMQAKFACVGLIHGTLTDRSGGQYAAVVPAFYIAETVRLASRAAPPAEAPK